MIPRSLLITTIMLGGMVNLAICGRHIGGGVFVMPGPRVIELVHETNDDTTVFGGTLVKLRQGPIATKWKEKGHYFEALDQNAKDENDKPSADLEWRDKLEGKTLPVLGIFVKQSDGKRGRMIYCESVSPKATDKDIDAIVQKMGG